jgi:hypothetical protein
MISVQWTNDDELFALLKTCLFTAAVGDVLDTMGLRHQFLPPHIQPLRSDMLLAGRASQCSEPTTSTSPTIPVNPN